MLGRLIPAFRRCGGPPWGTRACSEAVSAPKSAIQRQSMRAMRALVVHVDYRWMADRSRKCRSMADCFEAITQRATAFARKRARDGQLRTVERGALPHQAIVNGRAA